MHRGYIKLWRKVCFNGLQHDHRTFTLWIYILCNVTHKKCSVILNGQRIKLEPGQMITGRKRLARDLAVSERRIRTGILRLETVGNLTTKTTNRYTIVSVANWERYQMPTDGKDQVNDQQVTSKRPASDHIQECKNVKKRDIPAKISKNGKKKLPPGFTVTPEMKLWFNTQNFKHISIGPATDQWADHWRGTGKPMVDWDATWRNGMRLAEKWAKEKGVNQITEPVSLDDVVKQQYKELAELQKKYKGVE